MRRAPCGSGECDGKREPVEWNYRPRNGDKIEVQPAQGCPIKPRFLLDNHLGRLAAYLRMLGFDSLYDNTYSDEQMAAILVNDPRILLTRDRLLLMRKVVRYGYCPRSLEPQEQLLEVLRRFNLKSLIRPFHRCLRCNGKLEPVEKAAVLDQLEPKTKLYYDDFTRCPDCGQIYWKGSHFEQMEKLIALQADNSSNDFHALRTLIDQALCNHQTVLLAPAASEHITDEQLTIVNVSREDLRLFFEGYTAKEPVAFWYTDLFDKKQVPVYRLTPSGACTNFEGRIRK